MSVDIRLIALERYTEYQPAWGEYGPRADGEDCWFGDDKYTENTKELFALRGQRLTDDLIGQLINWPREACDDDERAKVEEFLRSHRGWYVDFWAG
jgi:hypothetical protein